MMFTGRESLIRLIGKRRRCLPSRRRLLSMPVPNPLNLDVDENGEIVSVEFIRKCRDETDVSEVRHSEACLQEEGRSSDGVTCPVCSNKFSGGKYMINAHLDTCLSRRTKRKLKQRTLLESNFWFESKFQCLSGEPEHSEAHLLNKYPDGSLKHKLKEEGRLKKVSVDHTFHGVSLEEPGIDDNMRSMVDTPMSPDKKAPEHCVEATLFDGNTVALETFIVGRRFSDEKDLNVGKNIVLLRDPHNAKDYNAIKVLSGDSGCCKMLGYLPKELSECLSPLIEKYSLNFEGTVTSVPNRSHEVVPIKIVCQKIVADSHKDDTGHIKLVWEKALRVVEGFKKSPRSMAKYQHNFNILLKSTLASNGHLFASEEMAFLESFPSLSEDSQRLFIRLYTRKGPWFRHSNLSYPELSDSLQAIKELIQHGFMSCLEDIKDLEVADMKEIMSLLTVFELREILAMLKKNSCGGTRKKDIIAYLCSTYEEGTCPLLARIIFDTVGFCVRVSAKAESLLWCVERLFFLNGEQDLSSFVLLDLGITKYPEYRCIIRKQIFSSRAELQHYAEAIEVAQLMDQSLDENDIVTVLRCIMIADSRITISSITPVNSTANDSFAVLASCFSASWVYSRVVLLGISFLEHHKRYSEAIHLLRRLLSCFHHDGRRGYWTVRLSTDLEHIACPNESLSVAEAGLLDPWVRAGSKVALQRRILRLAKSPRRWRTPSFSDSIRLKIPEVQVQGRPLNCETGFKNRFYGGDGEQCGVEMLALQYYAGEGGGWQGIHTESGIWLTVFGLLMWDILFSEVPDVFRTKFQTAPLDLETDSFYATRASLIEAQLQNIVNGMGEEILVISWESHFGTACRGVNWERYSLSELRAAVTCVGGRCLASLCRHLAQDYKSWSSGMPDLLLWRFHENYKGEAKLVEVKGPRDRLSEQQRAWLLLLMDCGFDVEVCRVRPVPLDA